ncbi:MAG: T9SS type A sorting domain-containing protein [Bacteroidales bacterium]|jgi:hypothetical protein|nr:T9SS type A sorting domain-containing protein [Bacteroidales bacterium]
MKDILKFTLMFILSLNIAMAQNYWINDDFSGFSSEGNYVQGISYLSLSPDGIEMERKYANFETIEGSCNDGKTGNGDLFLRIRGQKDDGYAKFTVPNAKNIRIAIKAKSSSANRTAEVLINGTVVETYTGLDDAHCEVFDTTINSTDSITIIIRGGDPNSTNPICINRIQVTKYVQDYWINDDFSGFSAEGSYVQNISYLNLSPNAIEMERKYANFETIEGSCNDGKTGNGDLYLRIRGQKDDGYAKFTVPNAGNIRIAIKAKSSSANRTVEVLINGTVVETFTGLDNAHCAVFDTTVNSTDSIIVMVRGGDINSTDPVCLNRIQVTKYSGDVPTNAPLIVVDDEKTTRLHNKKVISAVIDDPTDPMATYGIDFIISGKGTLTASVTSSIQHIVPNSNLSLTRSGDSLNLKIVPSGIGRDAIISVSVSDDSNRNAVYTFSYSVSAAASEPDKNHFHTGLSDASTAVALRNEHYFLVSDDETNEIRLYNRYQSGLPVQLFDLGTFSNIDTDEPEMDIEASTRGVIYPNRIYWCGSLGNSRTGKLRTSRNRLVVTEINEAGENTTLTYRKHFEDLREKIISWGDVNGYDFSSSAAANMIPKRIDGFNLEGMAIAPDSLSCYLGFRAPLIKETGNNERTLALIAPLQNFEQLLNDNANLDNAVFGEPILLDLGGRSIRSLDRLLNGKYLIVAGMYDDNSDSAALYLWSGNRGDQPVLLQRLSSTGEAHPEAFLEGNSTKTLLEIELINDNGTVDYYEDGNEAKSLALPLRKFRKEMLPIPLSETKLIELFDNKTNFLIYPNPTFDNIILKVDTKTNAYLFDINGKLIRTFSLTPHITTIDISDLSIGIYLFKINGQVYKIGKQ